MCPLRWAVSVNPGGAIITPLYSSGERTSTSGLPASTCWEDHGGRGAGPLVPLPDRDRAGLRARRLRRRRPALGQPLLAAAVHQFGVADAVHLQHPQRMGGEPVVVIAVEDDRAVAVDAGLPQQPFHRGAIGHVPAQRILQLRWSSSRPRRRWVGLRRHRSSCPHLPQSDTPSGRSSARRPTPSSPACPGARTPPFADLLFPVLPDVCRWRGAEGSPPLRASPPDRAVDRLVAFYLFVVAGPEAGGEVLPAAVRQQHDDGAGVNLFRHPLRRAQRRPGGRSPPRSPPPRGGPS